MEDSETTKDYYSRIKELVNQMRTYGENIIDKKIVQKVLITCTKKYDSIIFAIEEFKDLEKLTPTEIIGSLEAYEKRLNRQIENTTENEFPSKTNMWSKKLKESGRKTIENFKNQNQNQDKHFENKRIFPPCGICNRKSHLEKDCCLKKNHNIETIKNQGMLKKSAN
ncbi:hypothetical protein Pint_33497 [Pistacia integerrima]|uniref:Uncharacterized protein n=1 Tax=Pistacia integerrima TaxID=434235 RepID=A0ACC0X4B8_9ROSI|nr:hypothetical protein Pint_33497 [Pistacia integerrima]